MRGRGLRVGGLRNGGFGGYVDVERVYLEGMDRFISFVFYSFTRTLPIISPFAFFVVIDFSSFFVCFAHLGCSQRQLRCGGRQEVSTHMVTRSLALTLTLRVGQRADGAFHVMLVDDDGGWEMLMMMMMMMRG